MSDDTDDIVRSDRGSYILVDGEPVAEPSLLKWGQWMETADRKIARDDIVPGVFVSTVFLGMDHKFSRVGKPILYETMVFGGKYDQEMNRYATKKEALAGHEEMLNKVKGND